MVGISRFLIQGILLEASLVSAMRSANYSVQLMAGLAPRSWSAEQWAAAADTMIGKTQAHILSDLIEDLGIKLKVTEERIRAQIDADRAALDLKPLPPHATKPGPLERLLGSNKPLEEEGEDYSTYLPPGWTEEKIINYSADDIKDLSEDIQAKLQKRLASDLERKFANPNKGSFSELPEAVIKSIASKTHESFRKARGLPPGVRAYKREMSPLVQVENLQQYESFGFLLFRTSYSNDTAWEAFLNQLDEIGKANLEMDWYGTGMELIQGRMAVAVEESRAVEGATAEACRLQFTLMRRSDEIPVGYDVGVVLAADERAINALADIESGVPAHLLAVDTTYDPKKSYPDGYEGFFEVQIHSLWHHLFVALGSGIMTPVEIWQMVQYEKAVEEPNGSHDEL